MRVINLSSGSDGNLTYVESENTRILVDAGLSCKEISSRLELIGVKPEDLDAIVLTHEHVDHTKGVDVFSRKFNLPIYAHEEVWKGFYDKLPQVADENKKFFSDTFAIKDLIINPIEVPHDVKCFGFTLEEDDKKIAILTDLGHANDRIISSVQGSQLVYIEANHDLNLLKNCQKYPLALKVRIAGKNGHLSNEDSAKVIERLVLTGTKQIVLAHLSKENNSPDLAYNTIVARLADKGLIEGETFKVDVALTRPTTFFKFK